MKITILAYSALLLAGGTSLSHAQDYGSGRRSDGQDYRSDRGSDRQDYDTGRHSPKQIVDRLRDHERRINEGERSGDLTRREAADLRSKEDYYRAKLDDFLHRNHDYLTDNQENSLEQSLDALGGQIHRAKHNDAVR